MGLKSDRFSWNILSIDNKSIISSILDPMGIRIVSKIDKRKEGSKGGSGGFP